MEDEDEEEEEEGRKKVSGVSRMIFLIYPNFYLS